MRKTLPKNWDKRIVTRFLWFPVAIGRDWRWLEVASYEEEYFKSNDSLIGFWEKTHWHAPNIACSGQETGAAKSDGESTSAVSCH